MHKSFGALATFLLSLAVFMMCGVLTTSDAMADGSASVNAKITVTSACTFVSGGGSYAATVSNGQSSEITANAIDVSCNDSAGYAIYAIGYSDNTYNSGYHTDLISGLGNDYNIKTSGTDNASYWKMKIINPTNAVVAGNFASYQQIPSSFTKVASYTSSTTSGSITPKYEIFVGNGQAAGTYTGKVKYTLVHPNTMVAGTYNVAYNANGGTGTMTGSTGLYNFEEFTLPTSTFTAPSGYRFAGWCTTNTAGSYACDGTSYAAGDTATSLASAGSTATLYAYWEEIPKIYMQDQTTSSLATMMPNVGDTATLTDKRDSHDYTVAKIGSLYWMTQNLDLPGGTTLTPSDSNVTSNYTLPASSTDGFSDASTAYVYNSDSTNFNDTSCGNNNPCYSYYSYAAATAGTNPSSGAASSDICPKGWRLPTQAELNTLKGTYTTGATLTASPFLGVYAGRYGDGSFYIGGSCGYYWSSTAEDASNAYDLFFDSTYADVFLNSKGLGYSVRCVAKS